MSELLAEIQATILMEYDRASKTYGKVFNSNHEAYAVILEEVDEATAVSEWFKKFIDSYWHDIKHNKDTYGKLKIMREAAEDAAAEWIQVAAMCYKAEKGRDSK